MLSGGKICLEIDAGASLPVSLSITFMSPVVMVMTFVARVLNVKNEAVFINWEVNIVVNRDAAEAVADNFIVKACRILGNINSGLFVWTVTHHKRGYVG